MNIIEKAYRGTYTWAKEEYGDYEGVLIYAENASKAKYSMFIKSECDKFSDMFDIRIKRDKSYDKLENTPMDIVKELTKEQLDAMAHTIGHDYYKDEPYRNHYCVDTDSNFEDLINKQLAIKQKHTGQNYYHLTELGIQVIKSTQPILRLKTIEYEKEQVSLS